MIDENYHIEDIDDIFDSQNEPVKEAAAKTEPVKARIIFEDSTSNQAKKEEPENAYSQAYEEGDYGQEGSEKPSGEKRKPLISDPVLDFLGAFLGLLSFFFFSTS